MEKEPWKEKLGELEWRIVRTGSLRHGEIWLERYKRTIEWYRKVCVWTGMGAIVGVIIGGIWEEARLIWMVPGMVFGIAATAWVYDSWRYRKMKDMWATRMVMEDE